MIYSILAFIVSNFIFYNSHGIIFFSFIVLLLLISLRYPKSLQFVILSVTQYALSQNLIFTISSIIQNNFQRIIFPSGLAELIISIIFGVMSTFIVQQNIKIKIYNKFWIILFILIQLYFVNHFAYNEYLFSMSILLIVVLSRLLISGNAINLISKRNTIYLLIILSISSILFNIYINTKEQQRKNIYVAESNGAWATDKVQYNTDDWTLKSAYSYSMLYDLMENKHRVFKGNDLSLLIDRDFDIAFFMTPTKNFSNIEVEYLQKFLSKGGRIVFIADHTDLYGHARAINNFLHEYGISLGYDAVFVPHNKHAEVIIPSTPFASVRQMTGCNILTNYQTHVAAFYKNFVSEKADYTRPNFFAEMNWTPNDMTGNFPMLTVTSVGGGSIVICSESTIFSNFGIFHPKVLTLLDNMFIDNDFVSIISKYSIVLFIFILIIFIRKNSQLSTFIIIIILLILSKSFYMYVDKSILYYNDKNILTVKCDQNVIYEPYFENDDSSKGTYSYLLSNLPRYKIFPYYIDSTEYLLGTVKPNLIIGNNININTLNDNQKLLLTSNTDTTIRNNILSANENFSDFELGDWWTQIDISPFRKDRVISFVNWLKQDIYPSKFGYPDSIFNDGVNKIVLRNDTGEIKEIYYDEIDLNDIYLGKYLYIGNGVWGFIAQIDGKKVILGGDSFNDKRNIPFFSRYWYGNLVY